jgi:hypothetical protein
MIKELDDILTDLIQSRVPALAGLTQVGFDPPNADWRSAVVTTGEERTNLYLYDVRENLKLRSNERIRTVRNGILFERPSPSLMNCMYLITAWSPANVAPPVTDPTPDEHRLLALIATLFLRRRSLVVRSVYEPGFTIPSGRTLASYRPELQEEELPLDVAQPDGSQGLLDFWTTMGSVWRPALRVTVTLPLFPDDPDIESPLVTTLGANYRQTGMPATEESYFSVGGTILVDSTSEPVGGASVRLRGLAPAAVQAIILRLTTRADGRFVYSRIPAGAYRIEAVAGALSAVRDVDIPTETGEYDLRMS